MKHIARSLLIAFSLSTAMTVFADDASLLAGKWTTKKTNEQGESIRQTIEVKKDKFTFQIMSEDDKVQLFAQGDLKFEKAGPFNAVRFVHIKGGSSASDLEDVEDEYACIYMLDGDTWTLATNFDKDREHQKPTADVYKRASKPVEAK